MPKTSSLAIDALPDGVLGDILAASGRPAGPAVTLVCRRWHRVLPSATGGRGAPALLLLADIVCILGRPVWLRCWQNWTCSSAALARRLPCQTASYICKVSRL
ncbi:F-box LRR-repeat 15-like isoform B [Chlorella sorokiniana]|uniref:F-box LRR-repeat 15-like isoform B n=1 Tax=Chlorella sorokiniana TaxID=3076 RepID=A0A2P6U1F5_CHLSO|nr:F-box LRR-repeat 15-like isoform B [Chlorella sorokiniana]|eukprot:PRW60129.1 F-box LRR-repeat 15-like isoform B [Chlorella sorokiniana]